MPLPRRLDLQAIETCLRQIQDHFIAVNARLSEPRDPLSDEVLVNMLSGYALIDTYVAQNIDLFALANLGLLLEINHTVLCGTAVTQRTEYAAHIAATEEHFYNDSHGGITPLFSWYEMHRDESVWKRAAGAYVRILSRPQLFIEGNHRSGSLISSYLLMRSGRAPFVLSLDNAEGYFNPSSVIRNTYKNGLAELYKIPKIKKRYAEFLEAQANPAFLLPSG